MSNENKHELGIDRQNDKEREDIPPSDISPTADEDRSSRSTSEREIDSPRFPPEGDLRNLLTSHGDGIATHDGCSLDKFRYKMNHKNRGNFVIFNHKEFDKRPNGRKPRSRHGTDTDKRNLEIEAEKLGFTVIKHDDLTKDEVIKAIENQAKLNHKENDCFACAILTHGGVGDMLYARDEEYPMHEILSSFHNCQTLWGKPKLFFIQACRGRKTDTGVQRDRADAFENSLEVDYQVIIPAEADFFLGYSTVDGYYSYRDEEKGSWYIQALCSCLNEYGSFMELQQIMTRVNNKVAEDFQHNVGPDSNPNTEKQMPSPVNRLTRDLYFFSNNAIQPETDDKTLRQHSSVVYYETRSDSKEKLFERESLKANLKLTTNKTKKLELDLEDQKIRESLLKLELEMPKNK